MVGEDIGLEDIKALMETTVNGSFIGKFVLGGMKMWMELNWLDLLDYIPKLQSLIKGWLAIEF